MLWHQRACICGVPIFLRRAGLLQLNPYLLRTLSSSQSEATRTQSHSSQILDTLDTLSEAHDISSPTHHPVMPRDTRPFSFPPGAEGLSIRRQDSLQGREHAGEIYSNAYVAAVYNHPLSHRHEAQPGPVASPLSHEVRDSTPEPDAVSQQQPRTPDAVYTPPGLPDVLRIRIPAAHPMPDQPLQTRETPLTSPELVHHTLSYEYEAVVIRHAHWTLRRLESYEPLPPQLPHASQADPLQSQQHATDTTTLHTFATTVYGEPPLDAYRPRVPIHRHQIARKPLPENANVPLRFLVDAHPLAQRGR
jgi:hypothetical protein